MIKKNRRPKYVYPHKDRYGRVRMYFWRGRKGQKWIWIREPLDSPDFHARYAELLATPDLDAQPSVENVKPKTFRWLCIQFFNSPEFKRLDTRTQYTRRRILESCCQEIYSPNSTRKFADFPLASLTTDALEILRDRKGDKLGAADNRVRALRRLFKWAKKKRLVHVNIAADVEYVGRNSDGWHTWTSEELERYERAHPVGTTARLALDLLQYLGLSRIDVVAAGPKNVSEQTIDGVKVSTFIYKRGKTGVEAAPAMTAALLDTIAATPLTGATTYLVNDYGKAFTVAGFGNRFKKWCRAAGLPENCSAHGIRKAAAARAAENGATASELVSWFGWMTLKEATRYTKAADRRKLGRGAATKLKK